MIHEDVFKANAMIVRRNELRDLLTLASATGARAQLYVIAADTNGSREIALEHDEARTIITSRISAIDAELAKWGIYPPVEQEAAA